MGRKHVGNKPLISSDRQQETELFQRPHVGKGSWSYVDSFYDINLTVLVLFQAQIIV